MEFTEGLDLEDLESRLYSQVYHTRGESVEESIINIVSDDSPVNPFKRNYRYFENGLHDVLDKSNEPQSYIPLINLNTVRRSSRRCQTGNETNLNASVQNTVSISPNSIQNNITINQYSIPVVINTNHYLPSNSSRHFPSWQNTNNLTVVEINKNKKFKQVKNKKDSLATKPQEDTIIICISDDSSDCTEVEDMSSNKKTKHINTKFPKKYDETEGSKPPETDDDVIFIPPPPIEIINVDTDEKSPKSVEKPKYPKKQIAVENFAPEERSESSFCNDFLETTNIESNSINFNFGLHGSDFNSGPTDFRHPSKPTEYCETESSCSTNEQTRDFSNTVKTIVFDEVEFPREDIFAEKNLESFGSFITPRRTLSKSKESLIVKKKTNKTANEYVDISSDTSSSESDYETTANKKTDNLPNLSPMVPYDISNTRSKKTVADFFKDKKVHQEKESEKCTKRKKRYLENGNPEVTTVTSDNLNDCVTTSSPNYSKTKRKKKKRDNLPSYTEDALEVSLINKPNDVTAKTQKVAEHDAILSTFIGMENCLDNSFNSEKSKKKKKRRNTSSTKNVSECNTDGLEATAREDEILNTSTERTEEIIDVTQKNVTEHVRPAEIGCNLERSKNKNKKKDATAKSHTGEKLETSTSTATMTNLVLNEYEPLNQNTPQVVTLETTQNSEDDHTTEKSKKKKKKRGNISISEMLEEKPDKNVDVPIYSCEEPANNCVKDTAEVADKSKKKKRRENSSSERNIDNSSAEQVLDSTLVQENNTKIDAISNKTGQDTEMSSQITAIVEENNEVNNELKENEHFDKYKKKRKSIGRESVPEKILENSSAENSSKTLEIIADDIKDVSQKIRSRVEPVSDTNIENVGEPSLRPEKNKNDSNFIILDSDDSDIDFIALDDIESDLSLNCVTTNKSLRNIEETEAGEEYYRKLIEKTRVPLKNFDTLDLASIQKKQTDDASKWLISFRDRATYLNHGGSRGPRCNRCRHFGHTGVRCPEKFEPPACLLCGKHDHEEPRCPNKRCMQCGHRGDYSTTYCYKCFKFRHSICNLCKMVGHIENACPDLWRRYHLTTDEGTMVVSQGLMKPRDQQWCSGCAQRGHLEHECNYYNRPFPPTTPFIMNYEDNLEHNKLIVRQNALVSPAPPIPPVDIRINTPNTSSIGEDHVNSEIPSLLSLPIPVPVCITPPSVDRTVVPNLDYSNLTVHVSNESPNVPATCPKDEVIFQMKINFENVNAQTAEKDDENLEDISQIKNLIMSKAHHVVTDFLQKQMDHLYKNNIDPRLLKRKIIRFDRMVDTRRTLPKKLLRERNFWHRTLNMFVFGVHKQKDGKLHVNYIDRYLSQANKIKLDRHKRTSLFSSYNYIFGFNKHANVNYYKIIRLLIRKYYSNNKSVVQ